MKELNISYIAGLVLRAQANDSDAFAELYAMTYNKVYNYSRHYLRDNYLAQDAMQEIYIRVLKNITKLNDPSLFIAWLNHISFNVCYDMSMRQKATSSRIADDELLSLIQDETPGSNPENTFQRKDEYVRLNKALDSLPFNEKQVLTMRYYNEMKLENIAAAMDISRSSVKRYISSGLEKLRVIMKG